jgi:hypothetical protein
MSSNFPPGHPTGTDTHFAEFGFIWCEPCEADLQERQIKLRKGKEVPVVVFCKHCNRELTILTCADCEKPAKIEIFERDVNAASHYCEGCVKDH